MGSPDPDDPIASDSAVTGGCRAFPGIRVPLGVLWESPEDGMMVDEVVDEVLDGSPTLRRDDVAAITERGLR